MAHADVERYLKLVEHDLDTLALLSAQARITKRDVTDWKCTLLFYMACIFMKALGRLRGKELQDHYQIKQWINTTPDLLSVAKSYRKLEERSRDARYEGRLFSTDELKQAVRWFVDIRDCVIGLLRAGGVVKIPTIDPAPHL